MIELRNLSKAFAGVLALDDVGLRVLPGEIHALLGQNGSGKSTLIKILSGYHEPDAGELFVDGQPVPLPMRPGRANEVGLSFVHQNLGLIDTLPVLDNLLVGTYQAGRFQRISWKRERRQVVEACERFGVDVSPDTQVSQLRDVERASLAIVRALQHLRGRSGGLLVLDEPTVYLPRDSIERLFEVIREVAESGTGILLVTHQLGEVMALSDRVTVLRNGRAIGPVITADTTEDQLIEMILGRQLGDLYPQRAPADDSRTAVFSVRGLSGGLVADCSFDVQRGEILSLTGLVGMGYEDVPYLLVGATQASSGEITVSGASTPAVAMTPLKALKRGISLVPANRLKDGGVGSLSVLVNVSLPVLDQYFRRLRLRPSEERTSVNRLLAAFDVVPADPNRMLSTLSGGNQQKAILAKWLQTEPTVLLMHEPTQGVDIGSRKQIFQLIEDVAASGAAVVIVSSEFADIANLCDRVLVFRNGRIVSELLGDALTEDNIAEQSFRSVDAQVT